MLEAVQLLFLASLVGSVAWLVYLAREQDRAAEPGRSSHDRDRGPIRR